MPDDKTLPPDLSQREQVKLSRTVLEDLHEVDFRRTMRQDLKEVYDFYLDDATRKELADKDEFGKWLSVTGWVLKNSILRLSPARRLLLLGGLILFLYGATGAVASLIAGFLLVLLILMLELKDKLLAQGELMTGRAVQFALMPRRHPALPGWETWLFTRPANEVGGDLVDYLHVDDGHLGLSLGDVAGKGLGAALYMAKLQSTLRALGPHYPSLAELGHQINAIFRRDGLPDRFISMVYLDLAADADTVRLLNAGHLPPLILRGRRVEHLPKGGPALGLLKDPVFSEQAATLKPGDLMLVYSDGLTEARNEDGAFYEDHRLEAFLPRLQGVPVDVAGRMLLEEVDRFVGEAQPSDDLSLVLIRRLPPEA